MNYKKHLDDKVFLKNELTASKSRFFFISPKIVEHGLYLHGLFPSIETL